MNVNNGPRAVSTASLSPFVSFLALVALLFGVFVLHSEATGFDMHAAESSLTVSADAAVDSAAAVAVGLAAPVVASLSAGTHTGMLDCTLLAISCGLLLVLMALVFLTRLPAMYARLLETDGALLSVVNTVLISLPSPSLTALSISRV